MGLLNTLLSFLFPPRCVGCRSPGKDLCPGCLGNIRPAERESPGWIFPVFDYRDPVIKRAIWLFKYSGRHRLAVVFAESIYEKMIEELFDLGAMENFRVPIIIPVPLSGARLRERGYNQAALVATEISMINSVRSGPRMDLDTGILMKLKDNEHQARIKNRSERLKNIRGNFTIRDAEKVRDRNILLIDDILTTGATLTEARRILRTAGARKIIAFTVAH